MSAGKQNRSTQLSETLTPDKISSSALMHESERDAGADFDSAPETYSEPEQSSEKVRQAVDNVQVLQGLDEQSIAAMIASAVAPFVSEQEIVQESFKRKYIPLATATLTICGFRQLALSQAIEKIADLPAPIRLLLMAGVLVVGAGVCARMAKAEAEEKQKVEPGGVADEQF